jgi:hypothetical protein
MSARSVRKATVWSEAEWTHVDAQARKFGIPPLRFVREAALGLVAAGRFTAARGPRGVRVQNRDEAVLGLAGLLADIRALQDLFSGDAECEQALASAADQAEQAILTAAAGAADLEPVDWAVAAFRDAFSGLLHRVETRGVTPPPRVVMAFIAPLLSGLEAAVGCAPPPGPAPRALAPPNGRSRER